MIVFYLFLSCGWVFLLLSFLLSYLQILLLLIVLRLPRVIGSSVRWVCCTDVFYFMVGEPKETLQLGDRAFIESAVTLMGGYLRATAWTELGNQQVNDAKVGDKIYQSSCKKKLIDELHLFCQRSDWTWLKMYIKVPQLQWNGTMV